MYQGSRLRPKWLHLRPFFESVRVKNLTWSALVRVHGLRCSKASASYSACCQPQEKDFTDHVKRGAFSASASVEPGLRPFHTARVSRAEAAQKWRVCRAGAARAHCAFTRRVSRSAKVRAADGAQRRIWFQTKVKDCFLNQRRWTCWYSCRENIQVLSATASLVLLFFVFVLKSLLSLLFTSCYTMEAFLIFFILLLLLFDSSVFAKHSVIY